MNAIEIQGLSKSYKDVTAVDSLTLSVAEGELFSLLGVNGAGKTTTVNMLSCLTPPTRGDAFILGHSIRREPAPMPQNMRPALWLCRLHLIMPQTLYQNSRLLTTKDVSRKLPRKFLILWEECRPDCTIIVIGRFG